MVIPFGTNGIHTFTSIHFLYVNNSNLHPISHRIRDMRTMVQLSMLLCVTHSAGGKPMNSGSRNVASRD